MERAPHKSSWKERKKGIEEPVEKKGESIQIDDEVRGKLKKIKRNVMILCILLVGPIAVSFFIDIFFALPFIVLIAVFIGVFLVYFPISDLLRKTEKK